MPAAGGPCGRADVERRVAVGTETAELELQRVWGREMGTRVWACGTLGVVASACKVHAAAGTEAVTALNILKELHPGMKTNEPAVPHRRLQDPHHRTNGRLGGMSPGIPAVRGVRWAP